MTQPCRPPVTPVMRTSSQCPSARYGSLTMIAGPMFAGETTRLIQLATEAREAGQMVHVFKSVVTRASPLLTLADRAPVARDNQDETAYKLLSAPVSIAPPAPAEGSARTSSSLAAWPPLPVDQT